MRAEITSSSRGGAAGTMGQDIITQLGSAYYFVSCTGPNTLLRYRVQVAYIENDRLRYVPGDHRRLTVRGAHRCGRRQLATHLGQTKVVSGEFGRIELVTSIQ